MHTYTLTPDLKAITHAWRADSSEALVISTKGAPEAVLDLCHLPAAERASGCCAWTSLPNRACVCWRSHTAASSAARFRPLRMISVLNVTVCIWS